MELRNLFMKFGNLFMKVILHSPFHGLASKSTMLVTLRGRKSGKEFTTPVNYVQDGDVFLITSMRNRRWWRNLRGGAPVTLRLQGRNRKGWGTVLEEDKTVAEELALYLQRVPQWAKYFGVALENGKPRWEDVVREAKKRVVVKIDLSEFKRYSSYNSHLNLNASHNLNKR